MDFLPITDALKQMMGRFHKGFRPRTQSATFWKQRHVSVAMLNCPSNLHGDAVAQIEKWRQNDNTPKGTPRVAQDSTLPVILFSVARDFSFQSGTGRAINAPAVLTLPDYIDAQGRTVNLSVVRVSIPVQVAIVADDPYTAKHLAVSFCYYLNQLPKSAIKATWRFAEYGGAALALPVTIERSDPIPVHTPANEPYLTVLVIDMTLLASIPELGGLTAQQREDLALNEDGTGSAGGTIPRIEEIDYQDKTTDFHVLLPEDAP